MKTLGTIMIVIGIALFAYYLFLPVTVSSKKSNEQNIQALRNTNYGYTGWIFVIVGLLIYKGIWSTN